MLNYNPPPVLNAALQSDAAVTLIRGPIGSAKSSACIMRLFMEMQRVPPCVTDGIRRSKMVISRATLQQLKTTCLVSIKQWLGPLMHYKVSDATIQFRFNDVESDWILLAMDTPENIERLLSLELTFAWLSEFREVSPEILNNIYSRCGRYPSRAMLSPEDQDYQYGVIAETNSFSEDSLWYDALEVNLPSNWAYFIQPGAFEPGAENKENLPPRYYDELIESNSEEWCDQYIHNRITPSLHGQAVFRQTFNSEFHIVEGPLQPMPGMPLIIGLDTGRHPACVICQMDGLGRLSVMGEAYATGTGVDTFLERDVTPLLQEDRFWGHSAYLVIDPQCLAKGEIGDENVLMMSRRLGFQAIPAQTNRIEPRLRAVDKFLNASRDGGPAIMFDSENVPTLILAMQSRYRFKIKKSGEMEEKPDKGHPHSDLADALQYACLGTDSRLRGRVTRMLGGEENRPAPAPIKAGGWT